MATYTYTTLNDPPLAINGTGYLWSGGSYIALRDPLGYTFPASYPGAINATGQIVGSYNDASGDHGFLYSGGTYTTLNDPLATVNTFAAGINNAGQIVGYYQNAGGGGLVNHGFVYSGGIYTAIDDPSAGSALISPAGTAALGINDAGQIVGRYNDASGGHGFLYSGGRYITLDDPFAGINGNGTFATGINDAGQIVGYYYDNLNNEHGFLYSHGIYTTIDDPHGAGGTYVYGINNAGQTAGIYYDNHHNVHNFVATPTAPSVMADRTHVQIHNMVTADAAHGVLANDTDPVPNDTLSVSAVNGQAANVGHALAGSYGTLTLKADGSYSYLANHGGLPGPVDIGIDTFSYSATDGAGGTATSTLTVVVTSPGQTYVGGTAGTTIHGGSGSYVLDGGAGSDTVIAGKGNQVLIGGPNDTLTAGSGRDTFVFVPNFGKNAITNFNPHDDVIELPKSEFANFAAVQAHAQQVGHDTVITYDAQDTITLTGVSLSSLHASDFHLV
jgi:probable HAF family extracellular repeat protein/VCBS repeat-containing protein